MNNPLEEIRQKQRKLVYHFGEQLYSFRRSGHLDFSFSSSNSVQEKEITKLLKLLQYMDERICKFEELSAREAEEPVQAAADPGADAGTEIFEEKVETVAEAAAEDESRILQEKAESAPETVVEKASEIPEEEIETASEPVFEKEETPEPVGPEEVPTSEVSPAVSLAEELNRATEALSEPLSVGHSEINAGESTEIEMTLEQKETETLETVFQPAEETLAPETSSITVTFQDVLAGARFKSETEKNLFEDNFGAFQSGDEKSRARAIKNLSHLGGKEAFQNVCKLAMRDPSAEIRMTVLKTIGRTRQPENAELYRTGLKDEDASVRITSIKGFSMLLLNDSRPSLEPLLRDPDAHVRGIAATCLGIYGGTEGVRAASELWKDQDAYVRKSLVDMLAVVRAPGALTVVKQLLEDQDEGVRRAAENALNKVKPAEEKWKKYGNR